MNSDLSTDEAFYEGIKRVKRPRRKAKKHYDRISKFYDHLEGAFEKRYRGWGLKLLGVEKGEKVLEIGFGTGESLIKMSDTVGSEGCVIGIDISTGMAAVSKEKLKRENQIENISLICGDAVNLPFKEDHFQAVFLSFTLELFDTAAIPEVIGEIKRVMKAGGRLGIVSLLKTDDFFVDLYEIFHDIFPTLIDCRPIRPDQILQNAGFQVEKSRKDRIGVLPVKVAVGRL